MNTTHVETVDGKAELVLTEKAMQRQAADQIGVAFDKAEHSEVTAMRDIVRCGLLMLEQEKLLKYGQLGPWLKKHVFPEVASEEFDRCWRKARRWADLAAEICSSFNLLSGEKYAIPIEVLRQNGRICRFLPDARNDGTQEVSLADVLVLPHMALTGEARAVQLKLFDLIDGKTPYQLTQQLRSRRGLGGDNSPRDANGKRIQAAWGSKEANMSEQAASLEVKNLIAHLTRLRSTNQLVACNQEQFAALENEHWLWGETLKAAKVQRKLARSAVGGRTA